MAKKKAEPKPERYFTNEYELGDNEWIAVAYWVLNGRYYSQEEGGKIKRISAESYWNEWDYHMDCYGSLFGYSAI